MAGLFTKNTSGGYGADPTSSTPVALMSAGAAITVFGNLQANYDKATGEAENADYYYKEAGFARLASMRQAQISAQKYTYALSLQGSAAAKGGVDLSGSIANDMANTTANKVSELLAIKQKGDLDVELANSRGLRQQRDSEMLNSSGYNAIQTGKTLLTFAALA